MLRKPDQEASIRRKEAQIPRLAKQAVKDAFSRAVSAGQKVLVADKGVLYEVTKDGRRAVKQLAPAVKVKAGRVIKIQ